jgi:DNA polymerase (family 10)
MDKARISELLEEIALLKSLLGENEFKIRAYSAAAHAILTTDLDVAILAAKGELGSIKGVGEHIAQNITLFISAGTSPDLDELRSQVPQGVIGMLSIPGLGPKKARALWTELGIKSVGELEYACAQNRLAEHKGFGEKSQSKIAGGIVSMRKFAERFLLPDAVDAAQTALAHIGGEKSVIRAAIAGSIRRGKETVKDVDIVASSGEPEKVMKRFVGSPGVTQVIASGPTKTSIRLAMGIQIDLRVVADAEFPFALLHFTGSKEHNTAIRSRALGLGMKLNEYGLFRGEERIDCVGEPAIFKALGLGYIPPERREDIGEIAEAEGGAEPQLVTLKDIRGLFHVHTTASDGMETLEAMARGCIERGWEYMGVAEHSRSANYAGGLSIDALRKQGDQIGKLNKKLGGFIIFKGVESDILEDGSLDYPDEVLDELDFVIASVHTPHRKDDEARMTRRIISAVMSPYTTMLGHPTGRLLLARDPYPVNMADLIDACAKNNVIMELNANPHRLDIDWREIGKAKKAGLTFSINPDAHRIPGLDHVHYGVTTARKGGLAPGMVFNTQSAIDVAHALAARRRDRLGK